MSDPRFCAHKTTIPVESFGEIVALICSGCDVQLSVEWLTCEHANVIEMSALAEPPGRRICNACGTTFFDADHITKPIDMPERVITRDRVSTPFDPGRILWLHPVE